MHAVDSVPTELASWLPDVAGALVIAGIAVVLGRIVMDPVAERFDDPAHGRMAGRFAAVLVWGAGVAAALNRIGVPGSVTLPILGTVVVLVGAVVTVLLGPRLPWFLRRRRAGGSRPAESENILRRVPPGTRRSGREDAGRDGRLPPEYVVSERLWTPSVPRRGRADGPRRSPRR